MSVVGTPKRRSMVEMRSFASPLASSTPKKQKDESLKEPTKEEEEDVTTVIEVSKRNYRRDIRLLRLRLDEIKLKIRQQSIGRQQSGIEDKENLCDKQESFFLGIQHDLIETCDQLLSQCRTQDLWAREQQSQAEQMYKSHVEELSTEVTDLRNENSRLKQKLVLIDSKIGEVLGENKFLRWENEQFSQNIVILQQQLNEKTLANNESLAELRCMKTNQAEINRLHNLKLQNAIQEARQEERKQLERLANEYEAKLKDRQRVHMQELNVIEKSSGSPKMMMEKLIENNRHLYKKLIEARQQLSNQSAPSSPRSSKIAPDESSCPSTPTKSNDKSIDKQSSVRFGTIERISSDGQVNRHTIDELEEKLGALRREYLMERKQRENLTKILLEMSRDMKLLLNQNTTNATASPKAKIQTNK